MSPQITTASSGADCKGSLLRLRPSQNSSPSASLHHLPYPPADSGLSAALAQPSSLQTLRQQECLLSVIRIFITRNRREIKDKTKR